MADAYPCSECWITSYTPYYRRNARNNRYMGVMASMAGYSLWTSQLASQAPSDFLINRRVVVSIRRGLDLLFSYVPAPAITLNFPGYPLAARNDMDNYSSNGLHILECNQDFLPKASTFRTLSELTSLQI